MLSAQFYVSLELLRGFGFQDLDHPTLNQHLDRLAKSRPRSTVRRMHVGNSIDVGPHLMQGGVNNKAGFVDSPVRLAQNLTVLIDKNEIRHLHRTEMLGVWVLILSSVGIISPLSQSTSLTDPKV